jgi:tetraacyldisaccharide 4'-kinase
MGSLLVPLYLLYRLASRFRNFLFELGLFKSNRAPLPTISVGNISFGGSNKTPLAGHLVTFLKKHGYKPALISRGYKGNWEKKGGILSDGKNLSGDWKDSGDEPYMLARELDGLGVFIGKNRLFSCQKAHELGFDIAVLDDGFQHRRLQKDIDIVIWQPKEKIVLRESPRSLKRADILLLDGDLEAPDKEKISGKAFQGKTFSYSVVSQGLFSLKNNSVVPLPKVAGTRILAIAGIARPERFFSLLHALDLVPSATLTFPDHTVYPPRTVKKILQSCRQLKPERIITTQKDSLKIKEISELKSYPLCYLKIGLDIEEGFEQEILRLLQRLSRNN